MNETIEPYLKALSHFGEREIAGSGNNPRIIKFFEEVGFPNLTDSTSWCAAFVGYCLKESGFDFKNSLSARSYLDYGEKVTIPRMGDIVIYWRGSHDGDLIPGTNVAKGHVGFYVNDAWGWVRTLGGNQGDEVNIKSFRQSKVLGYRRPVK